LNSSLNRQAEAAGQETSPAALAKAASELHDVVAREASATIAALQTQALHIQMALDRLADGVCVFDASSAIVACNQTYLHMYALSPEIVKPGCTLRGLIEHRRDVGLFNGDIDLYIASIHATVAKGNAESQIGVTADGRAIKIVNRPLPNGGWVVTHEDVSERMHEDKVINERVSLQTLIDWVPDNLWVKDLQSRFIVANVATALRMGFAGSEHLIGKTDLELCPPEKARQYFADEQSVMRTGQPIIDKEECAALGEKTWILTTKVPLRDRKGETFGVIGVSRDITERKLADVLRDGQAAILEMIATSAPLESVLDRLARLVESQLTGILASILLLDKDGVHLRHGAGPSLDPAYSSAIEGVRIGPKVGSCGTAVYRRETVVVADIASDPLWEDFRDLALAHGYRSCWSAPILSHNGQVLGAFALYSGSAREPATAELRLVDVATRIAGIAIERKLTEDRIHFMANHDALTGLPNRALLNDRLTQALLYAERYDRWATVAFVDLDNFKFVNDSLGHNAGDELLKAVANRMIASVRATDTVLRIGGDEFVVVLFDQPKNLEAISATIGKLQEAVTAPLGIEGHAVRVSSSIGAAIYPKDGTDAETLLTNADAAMYRAKEVGRDNFQFYTPELNTKVHEKFLLQEELRNALTRGEFALVYQPQVNLRTGRIFAVEALIRWNHPSMGLVSPANFIPLAEETGLIVQIGDWVLREACRQNKAWQDAGLTPVNVSVNVSARQFKERNFTDAVAAALRESELDAKYLELELTESLIMQDVELALATMEALEGLGVQLSIDDFGTGYSSLSALKTFPVARLKIDRAFIKELPKNENDKAIAKAVISLGQKLNLRVIAEGVETDEQIAFLRKNNCDEIQGYYFSKPIEASEIADSLKRTHRLRERQTAFGRFRAMLGSSWFSRRLPPSSVRRSSDAVAARKSG
jgi:diguanylate cyclase (GGDEF)-like protein/PAS domain S-box-containing protein